MGMCSRQERIQKDIDVVIQKCKAEKDCLFAGEFLSRAPGWRRGRGGCRHRRPPQTPLPPPRRGCPGCARALRRRSRERGPPPSRRAPAFSPLLPPSPPLLPRACEGRWDQAPAGKGRGASRVRERGGGHTQNRAGVGECERVRVCECVPPAAWRSPQLLGRAPSRAQPCCFLLRRAVRGCFPGGRAPAILGACRYPRPPARRPASGPGTWPAVTPPFCANTCPPRPAFRGFLGGAGAVPAVTSRRRSPACGCLLPFLTMEIPAVAIAPSTCCERLGGRCCISSDSQRPPPSTHPPVGRRMLVCKTSAVSAKIKTSCNNAALCLSDFRYSDSTFTFTYIGGSKRYFFLQ